MKIEAYKGHTYESYGFRTSHFACHNKMVVWDGPSYRQPQLSKHQAQQLLHEHRAWLVRNLYDWDCGEETNFWEILSDKVLTIEMLPTKVRNCIRRSLRDCDFQIFDKQQLINGGGMKSIVPRT